MTISNQTLMLDTVATTIREPLGHRHGAVSSHLDT